MPRPCGPCSDPGRNELDRRLLNMAVSNESFRTISNDFGYTESALKRHKSNHLVIDLADVHMEMVKARETALAEVHDRELQEIKNEAADTISGRLEQARDVFEQLMILRMKAGNLLDQAETSEDLRSAGTFLRELREQLKLLAELEGRIQTQPTVNILLDPEWIQLRTTIIKALEPYPEAREAIVNAIHD